MWMCLCILPCACLLFRLTLLLGPPSSGKTTFLLALAGRLKSDLQVWKIPAISSAMLTRNVHLNIQIELLAHWYFNLLKVSGNITYNGHGLKEFVPQRTSAYVNQQDWHVAETTVRETLDFAARCQGVGYKYGKVSKVLWPQYRSVGC